MNKSNFQDLSDVIRAAHSSALQRGLWQKDDPDSYILGLLVGELGELLAAHCKQRFARREGFNRRMEDVRLRDNKNLQEHWKTAFLVYIKDSIEDEMADVVILLANLAGQRSYKIALGDEFADIQMDVFPIFIYQLISYIGWIETEEYISKVIGQMFRLAQYLNVDLWWHIEQKIRYNNLRTR